MENINFLENIATRLGQSASVKNVYGEAIVAGDKTIIPVAQIAYGFGGGYGRSKKKLPKSNNQTENKKRKHGEGLGSGGGILVKPKGVYEISKQGTKFIPANYTRVILTGIIIGFLLRGIIRKKSI